MPVYGLQPSMTAGEIAPSLHNRFDKPGIFGLGLHTCRNFFVMAHGGVSNRPGTEWVGEAKDSTQQVRLVPFKFNTEQAYVLEFGHQYIRVIRDGGLVIYPAGYPNEGLPVEIATPYSGQDLVLVKRTQSADVLTLCHPGYPPKELRRTSHYDWTLTDFTVGPSIGTPTGLTVTPTGSGSVAYEYVVSAVDAESGEEGLPCTAVSATNASLSDTAYNTLNWTAVTGAGSYIVYKKKGGVFGFIGRATGTSFKDDNIAAETDDTPSEFRDPFAGGNYPGTATYHQQRLMFGQSTAKPQHIWASTTGAFNNFNESLPYKDDDAMELRLNSREVNEVRHLIGLKELLALTAGGEWVISSGNDPFALKYLKTDQHGFTGCSHLAPIVVGGAILYVQAQGNVVVDMAYALDSDGYAGKNRSVLANHLFDNYRIVDWAYAQAPYSIVWAVRDDGTLLGMTYLREHEVWGWHRHDTKGGAFESICTIPEGNEDAVYFVVRRTINGQTKRYIERLHTRVFSASADAFFVDCGLTYDGTPTDTLTGLDHLEGEEVAILADGAVEPRQVVSGGTITLTRAYSQVHVGLPIEADLVTLRMSLQNGEGAMGTAKSVASLTLALERSRGVFAGPSFDLLAELKPEITAYDTPPDLITGDVRMTLHSGWSELGSVYIRQSHPLPLTILAIAPEVEFGG